MPRPCHCPGTTSLKNSFPLKFAWRVNLQFWTHQEEKLVHFCLYKLQSFTPSTSIEGKRQEAYFCHKNKVSSLFSPIFTQKCYKILTFFHVILTGFRMTGEEPPKKSGLKGKWAKRNSPEMSRVEWTKRSPKLLNLLFCKPPRLLNL